MFACEVCTHTTQSLKVYVLHYQFHKHIPNVIYPCPIAGCSRRYSSYTTFKSHISRDHSKFRKPPNRQITTDVSVICPLHSCNERNESWSKFIAHLKLHIDNGLKVSCPFTNCLNEFNNKSSLTSHLSRKHRNWSLNDVNRTLIQNSDTLNLGYVNSDQSGDINGDGWDAMNEDDDSHSAANEIIDQNNLLDTLSLFYLKLQAKLLLPVSTIQQIIEGYQEVHEKGQVYLYKILKDKLTDLGGVCEEDIQTVINDLTKNDLLKEYNSGILRSNQTRKTYYKQNLKYIEPVSIYLGRDKFGKHAYFQYVPLCKTLEAFLSHGSVWDHICHFAQSRLDGAEKEIYADITDGHVYRTNQFFQSDPMSIALILYQDAFEVVNPLGAGKKKHKILAVYYTLANLPPHCRSSIDPLQLVLLCKENDFKYFNQENIFGPLIDDLKVLEENGLFLQKHGQTIKSSVSVIVGDNLGSHCIGGFTENFSTTLHMCRYCLIARNEFLDKPYMTGTVRTVEHYDEVVAHLENLDDPGIEFGIKKNSVFNQLSHFHVCQPGLPPCLGHDLFEGVVSFDLALYIKYFVKTRKWFTYVQLNQMISKFKFLGSDASNKLNEINANGIKVGGQAVQNWCFLRLFPLIIHSKIADFGDEVWQLMLQLRDIVEIICAPQLDNGLIASLKVLTAEYLECRKELFPDTPLRPKHHYISHYSDLCLKFGPLIRLWTLRFESKHTYFKRCIRRTQNFKNVCQTLAERHQLLQAYFTAGDILPPSLYFESGIDFHIDHYSEEIRNATDHFEFDPTNTVVLSSVTVNGTCYKKDMYVVTSSVNDFEFSKVLMVLLKNNTDVYFIAKAYNADFLHNLGIYILQNEGSYTKCVNQTRLVDYYPLPGYLLNSSTVVSLHHKFIESI